jgi:hypothetical protein
LKREVAWKKLSGDVFRKPTLPLILSVLFGTGMQLLMLVVSLLGATFAGKISPFNFSVVQGLAVFIFPVCGVMNGFCGGRLYSFLHGANWIVLWFISSFFFPMIIGVCLVAVDFCEYIENGRI